MPDAIEPIPDQGFISAEKLGRWRRSSPAVYPPAVTGLSDVPWQIWVVVLLLGLEGINDFLILPQVPRAVFWIIAKVLFIVGLLNRWRPVFVLFLVVAAIHVFNPEAIGEFAAMLNLVLVILVASALRFFFPKSAVPQ